MLSGDVADEVGRLKDRPGGDILVPGSAQLTDAQLSARRRRRRDGVIITG